MNRRFFIATAAAFISAPKLLIAGGMQTVDYTPGLIKEKLAAGEIVFVDFAADWCSTCKRQERVISELREANPEFDKHISFIRVDWDQYSSHEVAQSRNIPRRSTLLLLKGDEELGRIVAGTSSDEIKALLQKGLAGA
ncbi:MAG: thioredoxin family protein [Gammaproteobacteria bacterium]|nr:thioredoxin family protein [Gammaproteobacteria bacterium]